MGGKGWRVLCEVGLYYCLWGSQSLVAKAATDTAQHSPTCWILDAQSAMEAQTGAANSRRVREKLGDEAKNMSPVPPEIGSRKHQSIAGSELWQRSICLTKVAFFLHGPCKLLSFLQVNTYALPWGASLRLRLGMWQPHMLCWRVELHLNHCCCEAKGSSFQLSPQAHSTQYTAHSSGEQGKPHH